MIVLLTLLLLPSLSTTKLRVLSVAEHQREFWMLRGLLFTILLEMFSEKFAGVLRLRHIVFLVSLFGVQERLDLLDLLRKLFSVVSEQCSTKIENFRTIWICLALYNVALLDIRTIASLSTARRAERLSASDKSSIPMSSKSSARSFSMHVIATPRC